MQSFQGLACSSCTARRGSRRILPCFCFALAGLAVSLARADTVSFPATADTGLFESNSDNNLGGHSDVPAGTTGSGFKSRGLFKFDLAAQIPANAVLTAVSLTLKVTRTSSGASNSTFHLYRVLRDWGEGTKTGSTGQPATTGEATWNARSAPATQWDSPGAKSGMDYAAADSASQSVTGLGSYTFGSTSNLIADVQAWRDDPTANNGWILATRDESIVATARRFGSREDNANAPVLTVQYVLPAPPPPLLTGIGIINNVSRFEFAAEPGRTYTVESHGSLNAGTWTTVTSIPAQPAVTKIVVTDAISASRKFYRVRTP